MVPLLAAAVLARALAQAPPDPCAAVAPEAPDPAAALEYQAVGDEERAAGREDSAALAYRAALARDPALAGARAALDALCAGRRRDDAFARGLALVRAGDCRGALSALDEARAAGEPGASLLAGVCRYRLGEDEAAAEALREAERAPETRASAELYLGLLALRGGRPGEASPLFQSATADPALAPVARELARAARREGRFVFSALAEGGWDSNAPLAPGGAVSPPGAADAFAGTTVLVSIAPWLERGPYLRGAVTAQRQDRRGELDLLSGGAAAGVPFGGPARRLVLEYGFDARRVGGAPYLTAHRLLADGRVTAGRAWTFGLAYALRSEVYRPSDAADDSGLHHALLADATAAMGVARLTLAWQGGLDRARARWRGWVEQGPLLGLTAPLAPRTRGALELAWTWRAYAAFDPDLELRRRDSYLDAAARVEIELADRWTAYASLAARRTSSNVPDLRYARLVPTAGISFSAGLP